MTEKSSFRAQAYNNAWASYRILGACGQLSSDALLAKRTSFFPTILATLNHIVTVDWFYVSALEGASMGPDAFEPENPFSDFIELKKAQEEVDRRLIAVCDQMDAAALAGVIELDRGTRIQIERADRVLLHLFQHQTHHRGQVHAMLSGTNTRPPQLDEFYLTGGDKDLRRPDFDALGFSENEIWRD